MKQQNQKGDVSVDTELYTAEAAEGVLRTQAELEVEDPKDGEAVMGRLLKKKDGEA
jgi:hypothetical protein